MHHVHAMAHAVSQYLGCALDQRGETFYLTIAVDDDDQRGGGRTQMITMNLTQDEQNILIGSEVGTYQEGLDLAKMLRRMSRALYCRLYLTDEDSREEKLAIEAGISTDGIGVERVAKICQEVARMADQLENRFFGGDEN